MRLHWNGCGLILHELCHIIHQFALPGGLHNPTVKKLHSHCRMSGKFDRVLRRDWAGRDIDYDIAYATVNHKEFFAEISVAFLCDHYHYLDRQSKTMAYSSPPLLLPTLIQAMQKKNLDYHQSPTYKACQYWNDNQSHHKNSSLSQWLMNRNVPSLPHCNKFFPFTRGQLQQFDPPLMKAFEELWEFISDWEDESNEPNCFFAICS